jgi:hypothetical protein
MPGLMEVKNDFQVENDFLRMDDYPSGTLRGMEVSLVKKQKKQGATGRKKVKVTLTLSAETVCGLDVMAAQQSLSTGRRVDRSRLVEELVTPHTRRFVVSVRGGSVAPDESPA